MHIPIEKYKDLKDIIKDCKLVIEADRKLSQKHDINSNNIILRDYIETDKNENIVLELWICNNGSQIEKEEIFNNPGRILGYPDCCIKKYEEVSSFKYYYDDYLLSSQINFWEINKIASFFIDFLPFTNYFPCQLNCKKSKVFSQSILEVAQKVLPDGLYDQICYYMQSPVVVVNGTILLISDWNIDNNNDIICTSKGAKHRELKSIYNYNKILDKKKPYVIPFEHFNNAKILKLVNNDRECVSIQLKYE